MRKLLLIFSICSSLSLTIFGERLMTYNIRNCIGMDEHQNIERVADVINRARPTIVALQEVDSATERSGGVVISDTLARLTGLYPIFAPAIEFQGGKYGVALLLKERPLNVRSVPLPGREESRVILIADFADFSIASTHLSLTEPDRLASLCLLDSIAAASKQPLIIMGDFNDTPQSTFIRQMEKTFSHLAPSDEPTWPADSPTERLDYIMTTDPEAFEVKSHAIISTQASDHRPIVIEY